MPLPDPLERLFRQHSSFWNDDNGGEDTLFSSFPSPGAIRQAFSSSSYAYQEDDSQVSISMDLPGVRAKDLQLNLLSSGPNQNSCIVELQAQRMLRNQEQTKATFKERFSLGGYHNNVDCEKLAANLSRGVLTLTAPKKEPSPVKPKRSIPITEREE